MIRWLFNKLYRIHPPEYVQYWKRGDKARAKLMVMEDGAYAMGIEGEKYPLMAFPRGPILFGAVQTIKTTAKNVLFNQVWKMIEEGYSNQAIGSYVKQVAIPTIIRESEQYHYDMLPVIRMCRAMKEVWRAMTVVERLFEQREARLQFQALKRAITFFFQEDDAYRFRVQWVSKYLNPNTWYRRIYRLITRKPYSLRDELSKVMEFLGHAEVTTDMKGRARLIGRVLLTILEDEELCGVIENVFKELNWKELALSKGDRYYFRGKYFKVDLERYDY